MGLIRKSLAVGTIGVVSPSSKKQRVAKAIERNTKATAANTAATNAALAAQAAADAEYRYVTDPAWRAHVDAQRAAAAEQARLRRERQAEQWRRAGQVAQQAVLVPLVGLVVAVVAIAVWAPQRIVAVISGEPAPLWLRHSLRSAWAKAVHPSQPAIVENPVTTAV